jgi:hypothetical protein
VVVLTNICEKHKSTSPSAVQVKNQLQAIDIEEKLGVKGKLKKAELLTCCNVRLDHISIRTVCDNADRINPLAY